MGIGFWLLRFSAVFAAGFAVIGATRLVRGYSLEESAIYSAFWAVVAGVIFVAARIYHARKGRHCELCKETVDPRRASTTLTRRAGR